jgi:hypothetical protein
VLLGSVAPAGAQSYPRVIGSGENMEIEYGPGGQRTPLFGGGRVVISMMDGANVTLMHLDAEFVQQPREGFVPLVIGSGESNEVIYVRPAMIEMLRRARASMPAR